MTRSKIFFYFCLSFILGICFSSLIKISFVFMLIFLISALFFIFVLFRYKKIVLAGFCLIFLILGIYRHQQAELKIINSQLRKYNDSGQEIILTGMVIKEPDIREKSQKLTINSENINQGRVLVTTWRYPEYKYGDNLIITGKLETPIVFEDFNYKNYLSKDGIYSVIYFPEIKLSAESRRGWTSAAYKRILEFKDKMRNSIYEKLSLPHSSILGAMILGDKSRMSDDLKEKLNIAGLRHITAVSGMHITILSSVLMSFLMALGIWRTRAFYFSIILIFIFIAMIGFQPSAIRAGIMGGIYLLGRKIGRKAVGFRSIFIAGAIMLVLNPLLLFNDIGFQLSFLAVMGIILLAPNFNNMFYYYIFSKSKENEDKKTAFKQSYGKNLIEMLAMTLSAYIFTLPIIVYNFSRVSFAAIITNILIVPVVPLIMILGFIFVLLGSLGWFLQGLAWIFSLPTCILLEYFLKILDLFSQSWASKTIENVSLLWVLISYLILGYWAWHLNKKQKLKFLDY